MIDCEFNVPITMIPNVKNNLKKANHDDSLEELVVQFGHKYMTYKNHTFMTKVVVNPKPKRSLAHDLRWVKPIDEGIQHEMRS